MAKKGKFKVGINNVVSWGATVVIIGLMAKLQHWPWGDWMIVVGLGTEAFLFLILGFQREGDDVDWTRVYPELAEDYDGELPKTTTRPAPVANIGHTAALDKMLQDAKISPDLIGNLGDGLRSFGDKVSAISNVSDASLATAQFTEKVKSATSGFDQLNVAFEKASADLASIGGASTDAKTYQEQVGKLASNLQQLNAVYELELNESGQKLKTITQHYDSIAETLKNFNDSAADTQQLREQVSHLNKNLASLNAIYGNMLAAMNQPRV
ncbi:type IX secretion system motor protein PorL/GldL [Parapedobacter lycopersici]|uniref:type IX secretion system motor protein PorL/GldL n=1 Tax=Parapedobacter lycopersici TaxID=1864939 RepID=UPI00214DC2DC|nr:gliding motility protein GldL [Parapedobacter lycopersici]